MEPYLPQPVSFLEAIREAAAALPNTGQAVDTGHQSGKVGNAASAKRVLTLLQVRFLDMAGLAQRKMSVLEATLI